MAKKKAAKKAAVRKKATPKTRVTKPAAKPAAPAKAKPAAEPKAAAAKKHRIYSVAVGGVYPYYVAKVEKKGRSREELDQIFRWLTGYTQRGLEGRLADKTDFETFFAKAPKPNPHRTLVTGTICGVRVETIEDPLMREIRILDKLVDELAQGRPMEKILRKPAAG